MSTEERRKVLQMVADGKITAQEAARLMQSLEEPAGGPVEVLETGAAAGPDATAAEFEQVRRRGRRWSAVPLWTGVAVTVLSAWGMYAAQQNAGFDFWFFCLLAPLSLGILLIALGGGGTASRWLYVDVDRGRAQDWPRRITIALPLPLGLAAWYLRNFGGRIDGMNKTTADRLAQAIALTKELREPVVVDVDEGGSGERVQVFIG
jgi:hypothetical protein